MWGFTWDSPVLGRYVNALARAIATQLLHVYTLSALVPVKMPGRDIIFKNAEELGRYSCAECSEILTDAVQLSSCGHRVCRSCAEQLTSENDDHGGEGGSAEPRCPECKETIESEEGVHVSTQPLAYVLPNFNY